MFFSHVQKRSPLFCDSPSPAVMALAPLRRFGSSAAGIPCCPRCRGNGNEQWWQLTKEMSEELENGVDLNESGNFSAKAGISNGELGIYYAAANVNVDADSWQLGLSASVYSHFWSTAPAVMANEFDEKVRTNLERGNLEVLHHRTNSKQYNEMGFRCKRQGCGMSLVMCWPKKMGFEEREMAQKLMATFVTPFPYPTPTEPRENPAAWEDAAAPKTEVKLTPNPQFLQEGARAA